MGETPKRLGNLRQLFDGIFAVTLVLGLAAIGLAIWQGYRLSLQGELVSRMHVPVLIGLLGLLTAIGSVAGWAAAVVLLKIEGHLYHSYDVLVEEHDVLRSHSAHLAEIAENVQLSDVTKSIARREKERKALHDAIQEEILRGNWDAAYYLVDELEKRYGYRNEAVRLREEVDSWRGKAKEQRLMQGLKQVDAAIGRFDWRAASTIALQITQVFPNDDRAMNLDLRIRDAFNQRKLHLLTSWQECTAKQEVERSLALLKELDHYLSADEAKDLREPVRTLFKQRLQGLGSQFMAAYKVKDWDTALSTAERIQVEFPTSKMAEEVRMLLRNMKDHSLAHSAIS